LGFVFRARILELRPLPTTFSGPLGAFVRLALRPREFRFPALPRDLCFLLGAGMCFADHSLTVGIETRLPLLRLTRETFPRVPVNPLELGLPTLVAFARRLFQARLRLFQGVFVLALPPRPPFLVLTRRQLVLTVPARPTLIVLERRTLEDLRLRPRVLGFPMRPALLRLLERA
jgi:hypothetical protein